MYYEKWRYTDATEVKKSFYKKNSHIKVNISVEDEQRIIRSCGWLPNVENMKDRECFTRTGTHQVKVKYINSEDS